MSLTEEQRAAMKIALTYIPYWPSTRKKHWIREVLRAMIDSRDHVTEPTKMFPGFDLENARADLITANKPTYDYLEATARVIKIHMPGALAEIGRLRDENAFLEKVIHKKNIRLNELEDALEADAEQSEICIQARLDVIDQQAAKILELEADVLQKSMIARKLAEEVAEGKIGPDVKTETSQQNHIVETDKMVPTGNCWQITEERVEALGHVCSCLDFFYIPAKTDEALRVMLEEAQP